jgi:hypothetical protein
MTNGTCGAWIENSMRMNIRTTLPAWAWSMRSTPTASADCLGHSRLFSEDSAASQQRIQILNSAACRRLRGTHYAAA